MTDALDITTLDYEGWVRFVSGRACTPLSEPKWYQLEPTRVGDPARFITLCTRLFERFATVGDRYPFEQIDAGVWFLLSHCELGSVLAGERIPEAERVACVEAMYHVFTGFVVAHAPASGESLFMWWDLVASYFYPLEEPEPDVIKRGDVAAGSRRVERAMLETLVRLLKVDDDKVRASALHGLGHVHCPGRAEAVQAYLDAHGQDLSPEGVRWVVQCRDGEVL